jgi:L-ascorbate metabolism protein UlaG (beta-lactamase superfamily)
MVRADHSSSIDTGAGPLLPGGAAAGFVLRGPELPTLYVAGDTSAFAEMMVIGEVHEPEVAILPIGGRYTMDPGAAAWATKMLGVRRVVPCHYGTFPALAGTPEELVEALAGLGGEIEVVSVEPGQTLP